MKCAVSELQSLEISNQYDFNKKRSADNMPRGQGQTLAKHTEPKGQALITTTCAVSDFTDSVGFKQYYVINQFVNNHCLLSNHFSCRLH